VTPTLLLTSLELRRQGEKKAAAMEGNPTRDEQMAKVSIARAQALLYSARNAQEIEPPHEQLRQSWKTPPPPTPGSHRLGAIEYARKNSAAWFTKSREAIRARSRRLKNHLRRFSSKGAPPCQ
jgi:hypothetical protein